MATYADGTTIAEAGDVVERIECAKPDDMVPVGRRFVVSAVHPACDDELYLEGVSLYWFSRYFKLISRAPSPAKAEPLVKWPEEDKTKAMAKRISDRIHNVGCWAADFVFKVVTEEMARTETPEDEYGNLEPDELFVFVDHPQFVLRKLEHNAVLIFGDVLDSFEPAAYDLKRKVRRVKVTRSPKFEVI